MRFVLAVLASDRQSPYIVWCDSQVCCDPKWEAAYARFETSKGEIRKFTRRLKQLGVAEWQQSWNYVELFCGRGNGLHAMENLGFTHLEGVDLAGSLLTQYHGKAQLYQGDCRQLQFPDNSKDVLVIQGGLHHLPDLSNDLDQTLSEIRRVLTPRGKVVIVEPWTTLFLRCVHFAVRQTWLRRLIPKVDALQTMIER